MNSLAPVEDDKSKKGPAFAMAGDRAKRGARVAGAPAGGIAARAVVATAAAAVAAVAVAVEA